MSEEDTNRRLIEIAAAIRGGAPAESFQKELDGLLGTALPPIDDDADRTWTDRYGAGRSTS